MKNRVSFLKPQSQFIYFYGLVLFFLIVAEFFVYGTLSYSSYFILPLIAILIIRHGVEIDLIKKRMRTFDSLLGLKIPFWYWKNIKNADYIALFPTEKSGTVSARSASAKVKHKTVLLNLFNTDGTHQTVFETENIEYARKMANHIAEALDCRVVDKG